MQQSNTVRVRLDVLDDGKLVAHVAGCPDVLQGEDIVELREKVDRMVHAIYGERRPVSLVV